MGENPSCGASDKMALMHECDRPVRNRIAFGLRVGFVWIAGAAIALGACSGDEEQGAAPSQGKPDGAASCSAGTEGCACYGNDSCNAGLTCGASHLCVVLSGAGGSRGPVRPTDLPA